MALKQKRKEQIFGLALATPAVVYIVAIMIYPLFYLIDLSFSTYNGYGMENYVDIFDDPMFCDAIANTFLIVLGTVALEICLGFMSALILSKDFKGRGFMRSLCILPWAIPTVASAFLWRYVFFNKGWLNSVLANIGSSGATNWLIEYPYLPIMVAEVWKMTPLIMLILLAGLQAIPKELMESAHVDGADAFQTFRKITLPLMVPIIISALVIRVVDALRIFAVPYIVHGGIGTFPVLGTYIVRLHNYRLTEQSAAASVVLVLIVSVAVICLTLANKRVSRR